MHKKLEADLISLAHSILTMKNKADVFALKDKSKAIYEKLSMLAFVEEYVHTSPGLQVKKEQLLTQVSVAFEAKENNAQKETNLHNMMVGETKINKLIFSQLLTVIL